MDEPGKACWLSQWLVTSLGAVLNAFLLRKLIYDKVCQPSNGRWFFVLRVMLASTLMEIGLGYGIGIDQWDTTR